MDLLCFQLFDLLGVFIPTLENPARLRNLRRRMNPMAGTANSRSAAKQFAENMEFFAGDAEGPLGVGPFTKS